MIFRPCRIGVLLLVLIGGCTGDPQRKTLAGADAEDVVAAHAGEFEQKRVVTLSQIGMVAEVCYADSGGIPRIPRSLEEGISAPPPYPREYEPGANIRDCTEVNRKLYDQAILVSSLACDEFIDSIYSQQRKLRKVGQIGNLALGTASALSGFLRWGSVVGAAIGLGSSVFNEAINQSADSLLFGIPAATIGGLVRAQQQNAERTFREKNRWDYVSVQLASKDYFRICLPVTIETYLTESVIATKNSFLDNAARGRALEGIRQDAIASGASRFGRLLSDGTALTQIPHILAVYAATKPSAQFIEHKATIEAILKDAELRDASNDWAWNSEALANEIRELPANWTDERKTTAAKVNLSRKLADYAADLELAYSGRNELIAAAVDVFIKVKNANIGRVGKLILADPTGAIGISPDLLGLPDSSGSGEFNPNTLYNPGGLVVQ
jgi:hypothetical protein